MPTPKTPTHTPLPWRSKGAVIIKSNGFRIRMDRPKGAAPEGRDKIEQQLEADASLVVRCVNAHNKLVAALKKCEEAFDDLFTQCCSNPIKNAWGKEVNCAALNKAKLATIQALKDL